MIDTVAIVCQQLYRINKMHILQQIVQEIFAAVSGISESNGGDNGRRDRQSFGGTLQIIINDFDLRIDRDKQ